MSNALMKKLLSLSTRFSTKEALELLGSLEQLTRESLKPPVSAQPSPAAPATAMATPRPARPAAPKVFRSEPGRSGRPDQERALRDKALVQALIELQRSSRARARHSIIMKPEQNEAPAPSTEFIPVSAPVVEASAKLGPLRPSAPGKMPILRPENP